MPRCFAVIPAAGVSRRMGQPKLLLLVAGQPLVLHTVAAWQNSKIDRIIVVVRSDDQRLIEAVRDSKVEILLPEVAPPDMKSSVQAALRHLERRYEPTDEDAFLVAPADMPRLSTKIIGRLIDFHASNPGGRILTPTLSGKRGHPVLFPWYLAAKVHALADEGLDWVVHP